MWSSAFSFVDRNVAFVLAVQPFLFAPTCLFASIRASPLQVLVVLRLWPGEVQHAPRRLLPAWGDLSSQQCSSSLFWWLGTFSPACLLGLLDARCQPLSPSGLSCWSGRQLSVTAKFKQIASQMKYLLLLYFRFVSAFSNPHFS